MTTEPLIEAAAYSWWLALFVVTLAGSAWCLVWLFDSWSPPSWWEGSDRLAPTFEEFLNS